MTNEEKAKILIVDDIAENIHILIATLRDDYTLIGVKSGEKALEIANSDNKPDLILLDVMMPGKDGYFVCQDLKLNPKTKNIPIIFITSLTEEVNEAQGLECGAVDYITKPIVPELVKVRVKNHIQLKQYRDNLEKAVLERTKDLHITQDVMILGLTTLAEYRDNETGGHIQRTQHYVKLIAEKLKDSPKYKDYLTPRTIDLLFKSAPLHDIGKVAIPDNILLKPGKLTPEEFEIMKKHTIFGKEALLKAEKLAGTTTNFLEIAREITYSHHEKWDGSGYPKGLKGEEIPLSARLMTLADVYDALISKRVYKKPFTHKKAREIIIEGKKTHFDPNITDVFIELEEGFRQIALKYVDHPEERETLQVY